ncbi:hypothetical protein PsYK624_077520 [Phanerochaete sordida]|uniref:Uncharacterized protein n=1 Tax=Phanerochaete sordida TaxID=48140 RepID=A0A9P3LF26_9APHY|nr:hypothetical protein PsYK624_077520 [Phanerochaete sordida]
MKSFFVLAALAVSALASSYSFNSPRPNQVIRRNDFFNLDLIEFDIEDLIEDEIEIALFDAFFEEEITLFSGSFFGNGFSGFGNHQSSHQNNYNFHVPSNFPSGKGNLYVGKAGSFSSRGQPSSFYSYVPVQIE